MRHRGRQFAQAAEPRQAAPGDSRWSLQLRFHAAPLGHKLPGDQTGHGQDQHQRLQGDQFALVREELPRRRITPIWVIRMPALTPSIPLRTAIHTIGRNRT